MEGFRAVVELTVAWRDLDAYGHVNNAVYASYFETGRIEYFAQLVADQMEPPTVILAEQTISYKSPAFLRERLLLGTRITEMGNSSLIMETELREKTTDRLVATGRAILVHYDYTENKPVALPQAWREMIANFEGRSF